MKNLASTIRDAARKVESQWETCRNLSSTSPSSTEYRVIRSAYSAKSRQSGLEDTSDDSGLALIVKGALNLRRSMDTKTGDPPEPGVAEDLYGDSPASDERLQVTIAPLVGNLSERGKGQHTCPYKHECAKGGTHPDGSLVVFERNSAFKCVPRSSSFSLPPLTY